ncbi:MAG: cupin domain-containing protein [Halothiobacillaceae bacterium]|nr:cupin domain-containing protein [Halothiobacillaceae bacterium]
MSELRIFDVLYPNNGAQIVLEHDAIAGELASIGVRFERWQANAPLADDADQAAVLATYAEDVARLNAEYGFKSVDVVSLRADHPQKEAMRAKFLSEHTHDDFEVRFFVDGQGMFYLHVAGKVYAVLCSQGDLISVPSGVTHWFDMGEQPSFKCIRFFTVPEGWVGHFTGSGVDKSIPSLDELV